MTFSYSVGVLGTREKAPRRLAETSARLEPSALFVLTSPLPFTPGRLPRHISSHGAAASMMAEPLSDDGVALAAIRQSGLKHSDGPLLDSFMDDCFDR